MTLCQQSEKKKCSIYTSFLVYGCKFGGEAIWSYSLEIPHILDSSLK